MFVINTMRAQQTPLDISSRLCKARVASQACPCPTCDAIRCLSFQMVIRRVDKYHLRQVALQSFGTGTSNGWSGPEHRQSSRLATLAPELWLEILSYFPKVPDIVNFVVCRLTLKEWFSDRPDVLRALSQTCRTFRRFFLPMYWERLDVCTNKFGGADHLHLATSLEAKSIGLCSRPDLADLVRYGLSPRRGRVFH